MARFLAASRLAVALPFSIDPTVVAAAVPVTDLGTVDDESGEDVAVVAHGVNEAGKVTGQNSMLDVSIRAFLWQSGVLQSLGVAPGATAPSAGSPGPHSGGRSINASGVVAGFSCCFKQTAGASAGTANRAAIWHADTWTLIGDQEFTPPSSALGVHDAGEVVGAHQLLVSNAAQFAFRWSGSGPLETLQRGERRQ